MTGCVTIDKNQNFTHLEKLLLQWNFKLGYTGFAKVQCIGRQGWMENMGENMGRNNFKTPKCADCSMGSKKEIQKLKK